MTLRVAPTTVWLFVIGLGLLSIHDHIFAAFLPGPEGLVGHDFSGGLSALLDSYYWSINNGIFSQPWFTPSFCGGLPLFASPINSFATPEFLVLLVDPLIAFRITTIIFSAVGLLGTWLLLRGPFGLSLQAAGVGAVIFQFNGFFAHRMIIGHAGFHGFMLAPLLAWLLLRGLNENRQRPLRAGLYNSICGGLLFTYLLWSGAAHLLLPFALMMALIGLTHHLATAGWRWEFWLRLSAAITIFFALSLAKLVAIFAFMSNFSRSQYKLPGADGIFSALELIFRSLFIAPPHKLVGELMTNMQWTLDRHEFEYGITWVALLLMLLGLGNWLWQNRQKSPNITKEKILLLAALTVCLAIPIAVNIYTPEWSAVLKKIPIIKNSSNLVRWFCIYIPVATIWAALALDSVTMNRNRSILLAASAIVAILLINIFTEREFYAAQSYNPAPIVNAYKQERPPGWSPAISAIAVDLDSKTRKIVLTANRNDGLVNGFSPLFCYQPLFGYRLEAFPWRPLHPGPVTEIRDGRFNMKNPACYVAPEENGCKPGEHFFQQQDKELNNFANYKPFSFKYPSYYQGARLFSLTVLFAVLAFLVFPVFGVVRRLLAQKTKTTSNQ